MKHYLIQLPEGLFILSNEQEKPSARDKMYEYHVTKFNRDIEDWMDASVRSKINEGDEDKFKELVLKRVMKYGLKEGGLIDPKYIKFEEVIDAKKELEENKLWNPVQIAYFVEQGESDDDIWNELGGAIHGAGKFTWYPHKLKELKDKFVIQRKNEQH